jgi:DNA polymerase III subunit delta'
MIDWHIKPWQMLLGNGLERISHASLLTGKAGLGQREFADQLAALLLCESPLAARNVSLESLESKVSLDSLDTLPPTACGACPSCRWLASASHPDFRLLAPEDAEEEGDDAGSADSATAKAPASGKARKASSTIRIGAIRELEDFVFMGSHRQGRRVVIIDPAEAMNVHAANALLKILEEPPASVYFILVSYKPRALLPTLRSRTRNLVFEPPTRDQAQAWLRSAGADTRAHRFLGLANGAPGVVMDWQNSSLLPALEALIDSLMPLGKSTQNSQTDPLALAAQWDALLKKETVLNLDMLVEAVQRHVFDLANQCAGTPLRYHVDWPKPLTPAAAPLTQLVRGSRELLRFKRSAKHPLNQLLFLEDLATQLLRTLTPPRHHA